MSEKPNPRWGRPLAPSSESPIGDDVAPTEPGRRWYQFSILQIMESTFWVAIGVMIVVACFRMSQVQKNTILIFAIFLPGAPFGAAVGALIDRRATCAWIGLPVWFAFIIAWAGVKILLS
jgi:uncharacterized membrane-anchored protein